MNIVNSTVGIRTRTELIKKARQQMQRADVGGKIVAEDEHQHTAAVAISDPEEPASVLVWRYLCGARYPALLHLTTMPLIHTLSPVSRAFPLLIRARVSFAVAALHTETSQLPSAAYLDPSRSGHPSTSSTPEYLTQEQREAIDSALRVNQAGEIAANYIYKGQHAVLGRDPKLGPLVQVCPTLQLSALMSHHSYHTPSWFISRFIYGFTIAIMDVVLRRCGIKRRNI